jgi:Domain of unknown function (DUF4395)
MRRDRRHPTVRLWKREHRCRLPNSVLPYRTDTDTAFRLKGASPMADLPMYDVTARKAHQWTMVTLVAAAFVFEGAHAPLLLAIAGTIMLAGRFWWPADLVRQLVWRVLQPAGILRRHEVHEDRETRRLARVLGGAVWLVSAALLVAKLSVLAWALAFAIAAMVALDASVDFCTLCFLFMRMERIGLLPEALHQRPNRTVVGEL